MSDYRNYQTVDWLQAKRIAEQLATWTILSAQLEASLLGFVIKHCLKHSISPSVIDRAHPLEKKHKNRAIILPFLKEEGWSKSLKEKQASEAICYANQQPVTHPGSVIEFALDFVEQATNNQRYLLGLNTKDPKPTDPPQAKVIKLGVHGMNNLVDYDHAAYLGATRPSSDELNHLKAFAADHQVPADEIVQAVETERYLERAYQLLARTSLRNPVPDPEKVHLLIVPDNQHAEYVLSWFEKGYARIDTQHSLIRTKSPKDIKAEQAKQTTRLILIDLKKGLGKLKDLCEKHSTNQSTFKRYRDKYRSEFETEGLLQPNSKKSQPSEGLTSIFD